MKSVLLIEDTANYREVTERLYQLFRKTFHGEVAFLSADSWDAGIKIAEAGRVDVIIADLCLPPLSPEETLAKIKSAGGLPPIIALTGQEFIPEIREKCFAAGCDDFLLKADFNHHPERLCEKTYNAYLRRNRPCPTT